MIVLMLAASVFAAAPTLDIKVDQVGYLINAAKVALVVAKAPAREFTLNQSKTGKVVFQGRLSEPMEDSDSADRVQSADFTSWITPGSYYVDVPGVGRSWDFEIGSNVYAKTWRLAMRSYYGQRCGAAVDLGPEFPTYKHAACHAEGAYQASSGKSGPHASTGGWHDAGDYGRYVVNSGISTGTPLWTYEMYAPKVRSVNLAIPESNDAVPDILNEIKWNLDWMLTMQDSDGGVWHKQTSEKFPGFVMPEQDKTVSYVIGTGKEPFKSSCATGDFAAVMAVAGRVYVPFNPAFATRAVAAAEKAWAWLEKYPNVTFQNPPGVETGGYGDGKCGDERLWAAAELFRTTAKDDYNKYFVQNYAAFRLPPDKAQPPDWPNVGFLGFWTYAMAKGAEPTVVNNIRHDAIANADDILRRTVANGYRTSMLQRDYVWGSNSVVANYGMQLLITDSLVHNARYRAAAIEDLHYLLGRNPFSLSFVTQVGANPVKHPHHRPSGADSNAEPWPGLLAGGPSRFRLDPVMRAKLAADLPPAKMFLDDQEAYAANEVAINWNAPLVFLLAGALESNSPAK